MISDSKKGGGAVRKFVLLICVFLALSATACSISGAQPTSVSSTTVTTRPAVEYDLAFDMTQYDHFGHIFNEKEPQQWEQMGQYTILLKGFDTPVTVKMSGLTVLSVSAYGQTAQAGIEPFQGDTPANIQGVAGAVVVSESLDYECSSWVLTASGVTEFRPADSVSTHIFVTEEGTLRYRTYWGEYATTFEQWDYAPLELCTGRDQFLYETGTVALVDGQVILIQEETVTVSDYCDLDALFETAKAEGRYPEFDSVDALFAFNAQK